MLCIACNKKPVHIKKRQLCQNCYQRERMGRTGPFKAQGNTLTAGRRELDFIKNFFDHNDWKYEAVIFRLEEESYTPDFFDFTRNMFIEVVGSKQAYSQNKKKYAEFIKTYPMFNFEIRLSNGNLLNHLVSVNSQTVGL